MAWVGEGLGSGGEAPVCLSGRWWAGVHMESPSLFLLPVFPQLYLCPFRPAHVSSSDHQKGGYTFFVKNTYERLFFFLHIDPCTVTELIPLSD